MELIVMKVALDAGVIGHDPLTMLMVMAILTTFMTGPLLTLCVGRTGSLADEAAPVRAGASGEP